MMLHGCVSQPQFERKVAELAGFHALHEKVTVFVTSRTHVVAFFLSGRCGLTACTCYNILFLNMTHQTMQTHRPCKTKAKATRQALKPNRLKVVQSYRRVCFLVNCKVKDLASQSSQSQLLSSRRQVRFNLLQVPSCVFDIFQGKFLSILVSLQTS